AEAAAGAGHHDPLAGYDLGDVGQRLVAGADSARHDRRAHDVHTLRHLEQGVVLEGDVLGVPTVVEPLVLAVEVLSRPTSQAVAAGRELLGRYHVPRPELADHAPDLDDLARYLVAEDAGHPV